MGIKIIIRALEEPLELALNAGDEPSVVLNKVAESKGTMDILPLPVTMVTLSKSELLIQLRLLDLHYKMLHLLLD